MRSACPTFVRMLTSSLPLCAVKEVRWRGGGKMGDNKYVNKPQKLVKKWNARCNKRNHVLCAEHCEIRATVLGANLVDEVSLNWFGTMECCLIFQEMSVMKSMELERFGK